MSGGLQKSGPASGAGSMESVRECLPENDAEAASDVSECDGGGAFQQAAGLGDMARVSVPTACIRSHSFVGKMLLIQH